LKPYFEEDGITIFHGDCREFKLEADTYDVVVCDPPYGLGVEFGRSGETMRGDEGVYLRNWICALGVPKLVFGSPRVDKPAGTRATLIWDKSELTGMGDLGFPWKATHEEIYVIGEGFKSRRRRGSVLRYPLRPAWTNHPDAVSNLHPTEKPFGLMVDLLECCPWSQVFDPTCGTGSTLQAAKTLRKLAIGIEIEERYCEIAANRLKQKVFSFEGC
jgi:DNA modification methylase